MPRELSQGGWEAVARAIFGYQEHRALELLDAFGAVVVLESDRPEWGFLRGEYPFGTGNAVVGAIAAEFGYFGLFNPFDSGSLCVATFVQVEGAPTGPIAIEAGIERFPAPGPLAITITTED